MNRKYNLTYIVVPTGFILLFLLLYFVAGKRVYKMVQADFESAVVAGAPEYSYETILDETIENTEGTIENGEVTYPPYGSQYGEIICETIGLDAPLYYGDSEEMLELGACQYAGLAFPGQGSTILIGGHDTTYMAPLEKIQKEDEITVKTTYGIYVYTVTDIQIKEVTDESAYLTNENKEQLILYTCYPFGDVTKERTKRYYVYAEKTSGPTIEEDALNAD